MQFEIQFLIQDILTFHITNQDNNKKVETVDRAIVTMKEVLQHIM